MSNSKKWIDNALTRFLIREPVVVLLILINSVVLFLDEFPSINRDYHKPLHIIDIICILYFIVEAAIKIGIHGYRTYIRNPWNKFDFLIVLASLPALIDFFIDASTSAFSIFLVLRLGRLFRFFRVLRFIPNAQHIFEGVVRSLKASVGVFVILLILNLTFAMGATLLFGDVAPEYFGDPIISTYSLFKVFTVEGWYEIPDALASRENAPDIIPWMRAYFVFAVMIGGILGLSLANAIFVDEMTADNTEKVEEMVRSMHAEMKAQHQKTLREQEEIRRQLQAEISRLRALLESNRDRE